MTDIDVGLDPRVITILDEPAHRRNIVQQTHAKRFQLQGNADSHALSVISELATGFNPPLPLILRCNDLALPDVFAEDQ